jgi:hypothetical protein
MGHIFEEREQIDFPLVTSAQRSTRLLTHNGDHWLMVHLRVVQSIQQLDGAWPGSSKTDSHFAGELRVRAGHKHRRFP